MAAAILFSLGIVALMVFVFLAAVRTYLRVPRLTNVAKALGLRFSTFDSVDIEQLPFALFHKGSFRKTDNVMSGTHDGAQLRIFDYQYSFDSEFRVSEAYTCAVMAISAACPRLLLTHEGSFNHVHDHLRRPDVQLEYDDFNRRFKVDAEQKFAFTMLDGRMMEWLLGADRFEQVEVSGGWVLVVRARLKPKAWAEMAAFLDGFRAHIPRVVYSTYPPA